MIDRHTLEGIARIKGLNLGNAERDYLLDIVLLLISRRTKNELIFKGGTALFKFYGLNRFSEDLDFTLMKELDIEKAFSDITKDTKFFGIDTKIKDKTIALNSIFLTLKTKGPLYNGHERSMSTIRIDINKKITVDRKPETKDYSSLYPDIPTFSVLVMNQEELLAEKLRVLLTREKARDLYDIWFMLKRGVVLDITLLEKKLDYYDKKFSKTELKGAVRNKAKIWEVELRPLVLGELPKFSVVAKECLNYIVRGS